MAIISGCRGPSAIRIASFMLPCLLAASYSYRVIKHYHLYHTTFVKRFRGTRGSTHFSSVPFFLNSVPSVFTEKLKQRFSILVLDLHSSRLGFFPFATFIYTSSSKTILDKITFKSWMRTMIFNDNNTKLQRNIFIVL
jgi:hypothetical protein